MAYDGGMEAILLVKQMPGLWDAEPDDVLEIDEEFARRPPLETHLVVLGRTDQSPSVE